MITRSRSKRAREEEVRRAQSVQNELEQNVDSLPKEVIINLLLFLEPVEVKLICQSSNPKIREICQSRIFREAYKQKFPKKLLKGNIFLQGSNRFKEITSEKNRDMIRIRYGPNNELLHITYIPHNQLFPSTVTKGDLNYALVHNNPMQIILYKDDDGKFKMEIGRENMYGITTKDEDDEFRENYNQEVKEFLQSIEREGWYSPDIQFRSNQVSELAMMEFFNQVNDIGQEVGLDRIVLN